MNEIIRRQVRTLIHAELAKGLYSAEEAARDLTRILDEHGFLAGTDSRLSAVIASQVMGGERLYSTSSHFRHAVDICAHLLPSVVVVLADKAEQAQRQADEMRRLIEHAPVRLSAETLEMLRRTDADRNRSTVEVQRAIDEAPREV